MPSSHYYPNRHICSVFSEMRDANKSRNYSYLEGLIEEAQSMANRMEAGLSDVKDLASLRDDVSKAKKELRALDAAIEAAKSGSANLPFISQAPVPPAAAAAVPDQWIITTTGPKDE